MNHYVDRRASGGELDQAAARPQLIDEYLPKVEEWVERSFGKVRADVAHDKLVALGYKGSERTTRRAVANVKQVVRGATHEVVRAHPPTHAHDDDSEDPPAPLDVAHSRLSRAAFR